MSTKTPELVGELQQNCSADTVRHMPAKDRNIDRHRPGWKRPSRSRPALTLDPYALPAGALLTRKEMCACVGISIRGAELWASLGKGPRIIRLEDGRPAYRVSDIRAFLRKRDGAKAKRDRVSVGADHQHR